MRTPERSGWGTSIHLTISPIADRPHGAAGVLWSSEPWTGWIGGGFASFFATHRSHPETPSWTWAAGARPSCEPSSAGPIGLAVGIDTSDRGWSQTRAAWKGLHLVRGTLAEEEDTLRAVAGSGFRAITLWHALEHDPRPLATLRTLRRLARSDGVLVVEVPDLASLTAKMSGPYWAGFHTPRHTAAYAPHTLRALVEEAGWQPLDHLRHGTLDPYVLRWLSVMAARRRRLSGSLEGEFPRFLAGKVAWFPLSLVQRWIPLGVQIVVARVRR